MNKNRSLILAIAAVLAISFFAARTVGANGGDDHTAIEEAEGKEVWNKLQAKTVACGDLTEENFGALGEYFMGTMLGAAHAGMNQMMIAMMGEEGEEQMHVVMGKRLSGCDTNVAFPAGGSGFMPMMQMMGPYGMMGFGSGMMGYGYGVNWSGWLINIVIWALAIIGLVTVIRLISGARGTKNGKRLD